ncbi:hypothetical protein BN971_00498 [Mycobacterium bohemicum DSM 44277]|uniref:DUF3349 domain-containing protein n=2 Tax=Mycobacterium bohemicum TaxID=56425 RepID=A0A1X1R455_MYCBE|nr:DUF3349 domain-containing protein [Mycobacterium bohemicum]MCV6972419.1 DUF3349 domain-containing protein [Mycobacterium bohemicum]ORU99086.1 hypothetical protein AWB93_11650 [Mycobacterium bohemicum]CPR04970.1 hypothetical protein BN971_00498 [Mycobacterium bohemicum DSM 44277]
MDLTQWVSSIVAFVRAGYPSGMPTTGHVPVAALCRRRVSNDEIDSVTDELIGHLRRPISDTDVGVAISRITNAMPSPEDIARVQRRLDRRTTRTA